MSVAKLLSSLAHVKKAGTGKWSARCPAHQDRGPSLSVRELEDGRVLLHCFAGCSTDDVLVSLNMAFGDLFPQGGFLGVEMKPVHRPWNASDVLTALAFEVLVAFNYAKQMAGGSALNSSEQARLLQCSQRIQRGLDLISG